MKKYQIISSDIDEESTDAYIVSAETFGKAKELTVSEMGFKENSFFLIDITELENKHYRYEGLNEKAQKAAYDRFAWDFINNKPKDKTPEEILHILKMYWFDEDGGTIISGLSDEEKRANDLR